MYPEQLVAPMREDLTIAGFTEFKTPEDVENHLENHEGTTLLMLIWRQRVKPENILLLILLLHHPLLYSRMASWSILLSGIILKGSRQR